MPGTKSRIMLLVEDLTPEETAELAGECLDLAGVTLDHFNLFINSLSEENKDEFMCRMGDLLENQDIDEDE